MARINKSDILKEIDYYKKRILQDPEGKDVYEAMIEECKKKLKK